LAHGRNRQDSQGVIGKKKKKRDCSPDEFEHAPRRSKQSSVQIAVPLGMQLYLAVTQIFLSGGRFSFAGFCVYPVNVQWRIAVTQNRTVEILTPRGETYESRRDVDACQMAQRSKLQIMRQSRACAPNPSVRKVVSFIRMIIHIYLRSRLTHTARLFYTMRFFFFRLQ
jgi:hypothetical protein